MTTRLWLGRCLPLVLALCLVACAGPAGSGTGPLAASTAGIATATDVNSATTDHTTAQPTGDANAGHPGGPGPDPNAGGGGPQGGTRPGAPYDIEVFENGDLGTFRDSYRATCDTPPHQHCHVIEKVTGDQSDPNLCFLNPLDDLAYEPPPQVQPDGSPSKIQEGTTVTATVTCPGAPGYQGNGTTDSGSPATDSTGDTGTNGGSGGSSAATDTTGASATDSSSPSP
jgi:hypothetical protein